MRPSRSQLTLKNHGHVYLIVSRETITEKMETFGNACFKKQSNSLLLVPRRLATHYQSLPFISFKMQIFKR